MPASPMVIPTAIPGVLLLLLFCSSFFVPFPLLKKNLSFSKFFSFDFDETHDIMLATQHQYPSLFPAPGTGRGFFCMCPWDLMVRVPVLFGPGWQASGSEIPGLG